MPASTTRSASVPARLLRDLAGLSLEALDSLVPKIQALRLRKHPQVLPSREAALLKRIQRGLPARLRQEQEAINARKDEGALTPADMKRIPLLVAEIDVWQTRHMESLIALATLRRTSPRTLARQLGLPRN